MMVKLNEELTDLEEDLIIDDYGFGCRSRNEKQRKEVKARVCGNGLNGID
jgi:hypothetical protein